ncbi:MAG TPA: hypothetical protein VND87_06960 [Stellaceae bacterium]|nr:hypothetical protein [Stellaceae bacterium]
MTRYGMLAAIPALALCAPAFAQMPPPAMTLTPPPGSSVPMPPYPMPPPPRAVAPGAGPTDTPSVAVRTDPATGATVETITLPPGTRPPPPGEGRGAITLAATPNFVWVPGHYNWDPAESKYVWLIGQYIQASRPDAHWVGGHWQLAGSQYAWIDGHFE